MSKSSKDRAAFRKSSKWTKWRKWLKKERKIDELTDSLLAPGFQVHHLDMNPENYEKLVPENFVTLNPFSHKVIHFLFKTKNWRITLNNAYKILEKMEKLNSQK